MVFNSQLDITPYGKDKPSTKAPSIWCLKCPIGGVANTCEGWQAARSRTTGTPSSVAWYYHINFTKSFSLLTSWPAIVRWSPADQPTGFVPSLVLKLSPNTFVLQYSLRWLARRRPRRVSSQLLFLMQSRSRRLGIITKWESPCPNGHLQRSRGGLDMRGV